VRVLVTGSEGFIGAAACRELAARGMVADRFDRPSDVTDRAQVSAAVAQADAVINLAGVLGTMEIFGAEARAVDVNVIGAVHVFDAAARRGIPVVQIGTGHKGQPNPYAITKGAAEDLALARVAYRGERITVVRAYHAYGPGQKVCPPHGTATVRKIIPSFVCRALTGMPLEVNGTGEQLIDLVHVDDVAAALVLALECPSQHVVEAGTGKPTSVLDAARDVIEACGSRSPIVHLPGRVGEPLDASVVAAYPASRNPWPHRLGETVDYYRGLLAGVG
jgi:UDP-glucose 4-epimerase